MSCPGCSAALEERTIVNEAVRACTSCRGIWIARTSVVALRHFDPEGHSWLADQPGTPSPPMATFGKRKCPACDRILHGYAFGGGNTRVDACDGCEHVFLDRGELGAIVREARDGIEMSDDARQELHLHRVAATSQRISNAELGLSLSGVLVAYVVARVALDLELSAFGIALATGVAIALLLWLRRTLTRDKVEAAARLERLMDAEHHRLGAGARTAATREPARRAAGSKKCPFCGARLPADSTHCNACDSDFG